MYIPLMARSEQGVDIGALTDRYGAWRSDRKKLGKQMGVDIFFETLASCHNSEEFQTDTILDYGQSVDFKWVDIPFGSERLHGEVDLLHDLQNYSIGLAQNGNTAMLALKLKRTEEMVKIYKVNQADAVSLGSVEPVGEALRLATIYADAVRLERAKPFEERNYFPQGKEAYWKEVLGNPARYPQKKK